MHATCLQDLLHATSDLVVFLADDVGVEDSRCGVERVDSRVDAQLSNAARQHSSGVQVSESRRRGRICQVIGRHVDSLQTHGYMSTTQ